jgi:subtilisin-like proprotein convertase family protein
MLKVNLGSKTEPTNDFQLSDELIAVRTRSGRSIRRSVGPVASPLADALDDGTFVVSYPEAGVEVYRVPVGKGKRSLDERKTMLRTSPDVRFAGGVLIDPATKEPVLYTENLFIKFKDNADEEASREVLRQADLTIKEEVSYATNAFFVQAAEGSGRKVFALAQALLKRDDVEYCHPELIRPRARKAIFTQQWHLKKTTINGVLVDAHAAVEAAHQVTRGEGITIAVIDDGVDIDHVEFGGAGKIVAPRDATQQSDNPRPKDPYGTGLDNGENHGTACAGVATANGVKGASGVAPAAKLMPIRLASGLGSQREAAAFVWAADHGADVISCSWGPEDGAWWKLSDPKHNQKVVIPASTRLAIDYATTNGRGGKGCVVLFAAGNGNEPVDNDGYASYEKVITVAACNDTGKRSVYSDFGNALWCAFPSSDFGHPPFNQPNPLTSGIWTTDRAGNNGYNSGSSSDGDVAGLFTNSFGGTSSACPGAAGVAALVLSVNPSLKWNEVKDLFRRACDRIDPQGGQYSTTGHSKKYGYGRLNARTAVDLAKPLPRNEVTVSRRFDGVIPDMQTVVFSLDVPDTSAVEKISVGVTLKHSYIGDLIITLEAPAGSGVSPIILHNGTGSSQKNIKKVYDKSTTPRLASFAGKSCNGKWSLRIRDKQAQDAGVLETFSIRLVFAYPQRLVEAAPNSVSASAPKKTAKKPAAVASRNKVAKKTAIKRS